MIVKNIFVNLPEFPQKDEIFEKILDNDNIKIERIISTGQNSPPNFWYEQKENEFVLLLSGTAELEFMDKTIELHQGDYLIIPAMTKHRVKSTDLSQHTIWLAIFY